MPDPKAVLQELRVHGVDCYNREQWGSIRPGAYLERRNTHPMPAAPADYHFFHITVTADTDTVQQGFVGARQVESYGLSTPPMVSYQDLVTNEGKYFRGQDYGTKGTHTINDLDVPGFAYDLNYKGYALAIMQNVDDEVTDIQVKVIAMVFAARELTGWVKKGAPIYPHRKFAAKACPGDRAFNRLDEIRRLKERYVKEGLPVLGQNVTQPDNDPTPPTVKPPEAPEPTRGKQVELALKALRAARSDKPTTARAKKIEEAFKTLRSIEPLK